MFLGHWMWLNGPNGVILNDMDIFICHWIDQAEGGEAFLLSVRIQTPWVIALESFVSVSAVEQVTASHSCHATFRQVWVAWIIRTTSRARYICVDVQTLCVTSQFNFWSIYLDTYMLDVSLKTTSGLLSLTKTIKNMFC